MSESPDLARRLCSETWDLMDQKDRSPQDDITMLHKAHTSCYLWREAYSPLHDARGEWQISRVYSVLGIGAAALLHGKSSLDLCLEHQIGGFDLAFVGYEAMARAYATLADHKKAAGYKALGLRACGDIQDQNDREYAQSNFQDL